MQQLMAMGFSEHAAGHSLARAQGSVAGAADCCCRSRRELAALRQARVAAAV